MLFIWLLPGLFGLPANGQSQPPTAWTPELQMSVKSFGSLSVSPDGRQIAYTVTDAVMTNDKSEMNTQIFVAQADGQNNQQITFHEKSSTNPKWSPDGKTLAFLSSRTANRNYIYLLKLDGSEARLLTETKTSVSEFEWSPDGQFIAFTMTDAKTPDEEKNDRGRADYRWVDDYPKQTHLYLAAAGEVNSSPKTEPVRLTSGSFNVGTDFVWSPDGKKIAFSHSRSPRLDDWKSQDISIVEIASRKIEPLAASPTAESSPFFSPDGKTVAFVMQDDPPHWAQKAAIYVIPAAGGKSENLVETENNLPSINGWSKDGKQLFFNESKGTVTGIYAFNIESRRLSELTKANDELHQNVTLNRTGTVFGYTMQKNELAPEVFVAEANNFKPVQISAVNTNLPKPVLAKTELIRWKSTDGMEIEGLLTYPVGYQKGQKVPLILSLHGGPAQMYQQTFIGNRYVYAYASLAAAGLATLRPNPRGSSGYGAKFRRANIGGWGVGDYHDVMTGVDKVIAMGVADPDRLGVMGWSYGGFLTSTIITKTKRFKAAAAGAPVTDLTAFTATSDLQNFIPDYFGGEPWILPEIYRKSSPIFNIAGVSTPTLIMHGEADFRVPIAQSYELYYALKRQNVPVKMLVLPRQPHGPNEPKMLLMTMRTHLEWFEKYLK